ncbi:MAG: class I SAM-dependent methyltransferase [Chloroflexota bacterium]
MAKNMREHNFIHYLEAKKSVDDRSLNQQVLEKLSIRLHARGQKETLKVLEMGGGMGTMLTRLIAREVLPSCEYTLVDLQEENILQAKNYLIEWGKSRGYVVSSGNRHQLILEKGDTHYQVTLQAEELYEFAKHSQVKWDLLICHAFLDLLDLTKALPVLFELLRSHGLFYFTINYDGVTTFEPVIDQEIENQILGYYNATMDKRMIDGKLSGDSQTGRKLFVALREFGAEIDAAGSSDWVVFPGGDGYVKDEAYFLHFIIHTIEQALENHPELHPEILANWVIERHNQIEANQLVFMAHQFDFLGTSPD